MAIPNEPITRKEKYLAKASGQNVETPDPLTREEMYLDTIAKGGGGGGGGGGASALIVHEDAETETFDKTYAEIDSSLRSGVPVYLARDYGDSFYLYPIYSTVKDGSVYEVFVFDYGGSEPLWYSADGINNYPVRFYD